jgi:hydroxypyruvate isomerase
MGLQMKTSWYQPIFAAILILLLTACNAPTPPTEFAPDGSVITKAISLQLSQTQERLSSSLSAAVPRLKLDSVNVTLIEPVYIAKLPAYHLQGNFNLTLQLPHQRVRQPHNSFDLYLQRQVEGKSWRLLRKVSDQWQSYLID